MEYVLMKMSLNKLYSNVHISWHLGKVIDIFLKRNLQFWQSSIKQKEEVDTFYLKE